MELSTCGVILVIKVSDSQPKCQEESLVLLMSFFFLLSHPIPVLLPALQGNGKGRRRERMEREGTDEKMHKQRLRLSKARRVRNYIPKYPKSKQIFPPS